MFMLIFPCGFTKVRFRVLYPIMEYITVTVSLEVNLSEYLPFRLLTVPMAVPSMRTVASSIGSPVIVCNDASDFDLLCQSGKGKQ